MLYIVSTPIGNLEDITFRAVRILKEVQLILAEDTRRTVILLKHYNINNKIISYNDNNKESKTPFIIEELKKGMNIAIVSDSGTPGISDPGFYLARECVKEGIKISPVPGATAAISALVSSGFPTDCFKFIGFIPKKDKAKKDLLKEIKEQNITTILYESPYRIEKTLSAMAEIMPDRKICIARELTKKFEEIIVDYPQNIKVKPKGEFTIVVSKDLEKSKELEKFLKIVSKSKLTEKDAELLSAKVKESMHKKLKDKGLI